jgi:hypothetical protein
MGNSVANTVLQTLSSKRHRKNPTMRSSDFFMGMIPNKNRMGNIIQTKSLVIEHKKHQR